MIVENPIQRGMELMVDRVADNLNLRFMNSGDSAENMRFMSGNPQHFMNIGNDMTGTALAIRGIDLHYNHFQYNIFSILNLFEN